MEGFKISLQNQLIILSRGGQSASALIVTLYRRSLITPPSPPSNFLLSMFSLSPCFTSYWEYRISRFLMGHQLHSVLNGSVCIKLSIFNTLFNSVHKIISISLYTLPSLGARDLKENLIVIVCSKESNFGLTTCCPIKKDVPFIIWCRVCLVFLFESSQFVNTDHEMWYAYVGTIYAFSNGLCIKIWDLRKPGTNAAVLTSFNAKLMDNTMNITCKWEQLPVVIKSANSTAFNLFCSHSTN